MKKVAVLGCGRIGSAIAADLSKNYSVTVIDINKSSLEKLSSQNIKTITADFTDKNKLKEILSGDIDLVVSAVPSSLGFETVKNIISLKKNLVDISFFNEDAFLLDELAKQNDVTAVVDCGVAPGLSNIILGYHNARMKVEKFECFVGGLPFVKDYPFEYKAPFSPADVIEEYTRPARIVENGRTVIKQALSEPELIDFQNAGLLEAFNTDGLRSLLKTMKIPFMKEKTLRYPGHIDKIKILREAGFFSNDEIEFNGFKIKPIDFTSKILFPLWQLKPGDREFTVLKILIEGIEKGKTKIYNYYLYDEFDEETQTTSMARTTGYTCSAVADLILNNKFGRKGIIPPEFVGENEKCFNDIVQYLKQRNISIK